MISNVQNEETVLEGGLSYESSIGPGHKQTFRGGAVGFGA